MFSKDFVRHIREFARAFRNHKWERTDNGLILFQEQKAQLGSVYNVWAPDGLGYTNDHNLIPTQGLNHVLDIVLHNDTQVATWYVALQGGNVSPGATWTAANYASNATELTTQYSEATRVAYVEIAASSGSTNNTASRAEFTSATDDVDVYGAALLSSSTKGGTTGTLLSAAAFGAVRNLPTTGDKINIGITFTLTSS